MIYYCSCGDRWVEGNSHYPQPWINFLHWQRLGHQPIVPKAELVQDAWRFRVALNLAQQPRQERLL